MRHSILILGGTMDARRLAMKLDGHPEIEVLLSLAGRTREPVEQGVPVRSGGFGGAEGLGSYLKDHAFDLLIDATHPYATRISANAALAAQSTGTPLIALRRPEWKRAEGDRWIDVDSFDGAVDAIGGPPRRVFLALGRQDLAAFVVAPQHSYLVRSVDPVDPPLDLPDVRYILARGPFDEADELALLRAEAIDVIVSKNSGGAATYGKIAAARHLGLEIVMIRRPAPPDVAAGDSVDQLAAMALHALGLA